MNAYDAWKTRSPYEPGETYGPGEFDYEPDLDEDRLEPDDDRFVSDNERQEEDESRDEHLWED